MCRPVGGKLEEFWDRFDVPVSVGHVNVPKVRRELGQLALHVTSLPVPADERLCGKLVAHVMESRAVPTVMPTSGRAQADDAGNDHEVVLGAAARDARAALREEERWRCGARGEVVPLQSIVTQGPARGVVEGHKP